MVYFNPIVGSFCYVSDVPRKNEEEIQSQPTQPEQEVPPTNGQPQPQNTLTVKVLFWTGIPLVDPSLMGRKEFPGGIFAVGMEIKTDKGDILLQVNPPQKRISGRVVYLPDNHGNMLEMVFEDTKVARETFNTFSHRAAYEISPGQKYDISRALMNSGYVDKNGTILKKFDGNRENFKLSDHDLLGDEIVIPKEIEDKVFEYLAAVKEKNELVWQAMVAAGYIDGSGAVLDKFDGQWEHFELDLKSPNVSLTRSEKLSIFSRLKYAKEESGEKKARGFFAELDKLPSEEQYLKWIELMRDYKARM